MYLTIIACACLFGGALFVSRYYMLYRDRDRDQSKSKENFLDELVPAWCKPYIEREDLNKPGFQPPKKGCEKPKDLKEYPLTWNAVAGMLNPWQITQDEFMRNMYASRAKGITVNTDDFEDYYDYILFTMIHDAFMKLVELQNKKKFISIGNFVVSMKRNRDIDSVWRDYLVFESELIEENATTGFIVRAYVLHNRKKKEMILLSILLLGLIKASNHFYADPSNLSPSVTKEWAELVYKDGVISK